MAVPLFGIRKRKLFCNLSGSNSSQKISTHLLIMEVDFCPVLCIAKMPILQAFWAISHFVWYHSLSSNELQMV